MDTTEEDDNGGQEETIASRYATLAADREHYLDRAKRASKLTIPYVVPEDDSTSSKDFNTPYQSFGRDGVNNLASKLMLTLLPPQSPFFRFRIDETVLRDSDNAANLGQIQEALSLAERAVLDEINKFNMRPIVSEGLIHTVISGNGMLFITPKNKVRFFGIEKHVKKKDPEGNLLEIIVKETTTVQGLSKEVREAAKIDYIKSAEASSEISYFNKDEVVALYTRVYKEDNKWYVQQEVNEKIVNSGTYPKTLPWIPLEFYNVSGESYSRGYVEGLLGDLISLEGLSKSVVDSAALAAKVVYFLRPGSLIQKRKFAKAENGDVIDGDGEDIKALTLDKQADLRIPFEKIRDLETRLSRAFLMRGSVQRDAERVTATEIRMLIEELESALGSVYATFAQSFQMPLVQIIIERMRANNSLPKELTDSLKNGSVKLEIITGLEALGRGNDLNKLMTFTEVAAKNLGPDLFLQYIKPTAFLERIAASLSISKEGLIKTEEELQQERQAAQEAEMNRLKAPINEQAKADLMREQAKAQMGQTTQ